MAGLTIRPLRAGDLRALGPLLAASQEEGFRFLPRLVDGYRSGENRFEAEGEVLLGCCRGAEILGLGGLNRDPYGGDPRTGRIRHLYVLPSERRRGIGRLLVQRLVARARGHFDALVLRTDTRAAAAFYEALGFAPDPHTTHATHRLVADRFADAQTGEPA